jgi:hypothetical protein
MAGERGMANDSIEIIYIPEYQLNTADAPNVSDSNVLSDDIQ